MSNLSLDLLLKNLGINVDLVSFDANEQIPVFSENTDEIVRVYRDWDKEYRKRWQLEEIENPNYFGAEVERLTKEGALIAGLIGSLGEKVNHIYDLGCGVGISSLTYALLGSKNISGVDNDSDAIDEAQSLSQNLQVGIDFQVADAIKLLDEEVTERDLIFASSVEPQVKEKLISKLGKGLNYLVMECQYDEDFENDKLLPLTEKGFSVLRIPLLEHGKKYDNIPTHYVNSVVYVVEKVGSACP